MHFVTVSPKFQVAIPRPIRESLDLKPKQRLAVVEYEGRIEMIPQRDISELRGFIRGINTGFDREGDRV